MVKICGEKTAVTSVRNTVTAILKDMKKKQYEKRLHYAKPEELCIPTYWTKNTGKLSQLMIKWNPSVKALLVSVDRKTSETVTQLVKGSWVKESDGSSTVEKDAPHSQTYGSGSRYLGHSQSYIHSTRRSVKTTENARQHEQSQINVQTVDRVENPTVFQKYQTRLRSLYTEGIKSDFSHITSISGEPEILTAKLHITELEEIRLHGINEYFLFFGTSRETMNHIVEQGFDPKLLGNAIHLSESSHKAAQLAGKFCHVQYF